MKYKLNLEVLKPGDIILVGYNDDNSRKIQKATNSSYSHAMLYWYESIVHASDIVITENPSRMLFEEDEEVCILRLKDIPGRDHRIFLLIGYALELVGTLYDIRALAEMKNNRQVHPSPNRQMCAKFVAECFDYVCVDLVKDYEICTPEDIHNSQLLIKVSNPLVPANEFDILFEKSPSVLKRQHAAISSFLKSVRGLLPYEDIVSFKQLEDYIIKHPECDEDVVALLKKTEYLELWKVEEELCPYLYNESEFSIYWGDNAVDMAFDVIQGSKRIISVKEEENSKYGNLIDIVGDLSYYRTIIDLNKHIIENAQKRIDIANKVLLKNRIVHIPYPKF